jgi:predicted acyltransferase
VLFTAGWASLWLGIMLWIIDVKGWKGWALPLIVTGMNPLFIYVLSELWTLAMVRWHVGGLSLYTWIYRHLFASWAGNTNFASLLFGVSHALIFCLIAWGMYKKKIFIKI